MVNDGIPTKRSKRQWPIRVVLLLLALGAGGAIASTYDPADPMGSLTKAAESPFAAVSSVFSGFGGGNQKGGPRGPQAAPVRVATAQMRDSPRSETSPMRSSSRFTTGWRHWPARHQSDR